MHQIRVILSAGIMLVNAGVILSVMIWVTTVAMPRDYAVVCLFFFKIFVGHESFLWGHCYPCFGLLVTSALGFKARVDFLLAS